MDGMVKVGVENLIKPLNDKIQYVLEKSHFYQRKFDGIKTIESFEDFAALPFTLKKEVLSDQEQYPAYGSNLCVDPSEILRIHKTSGTTNNPVIIALTQNDINTTVEVGSECFRRSGLKPEDVVVHCLNYNMWAGGYTDHQSLEATGAAVVPFGVGNSKVLIETILQLKVNAIHCTPSYLAILETLLKDEFNLKPKDLNLRLGLFGAESGLQNPDFRSKIESLWGLKAMDANYGMSEVLSMIGAEGESQDGLCFMGGHYLFPELIDPETERSIPLEEGSEGALVLTTLYREAQPLIRYRTGDVINILEFEDRTSNRFRFEIVGRSDNMLVIRGLNVFPSRIEKIINKNGERFTQTYQIHVNRTNPIDQIKLVLEKRPENHEKDEDIIFDLTNEFIECLDIKPEIELVSEGHLPRTQGKSKKILRIL